MAGKSSASSCANAPPAETPTTWAAGIRDGKIVEYWSVVDVARVLQQVGALPGPPG